MQQLIFELIKVALGHQERLSVEPNTEEWISIFKLVRKLEVTGLLYYGIDKAMTGGMRRHGALDRIADWMMRRAKPAAKGSEQ